jgi:hypothetical protein
MPKRWQAEFQLYPDYSIEIPQLARQRAAEEIAVAELIFPRECDLRRELLPWNGANWDRNKVGRPDLTSAGAVL